MDRRQAINRLLVNLVQDANAVRCSSVESRTSKPGDLSSFGTDAAIGDPKELPGEWGEYLRASRATTIYGGTSEVQLNIIAERLLGLPRDP